MNKARKTRCKHFNGVQHGTCLVGVEYVSVRDESQRPYRFPCFNHDCMTCDKREYPTQEEIEAEEREFEERFRQVGIARLAIVEDCGGAWKRGDTGRSGAIECPVCTGKLHYSRAGYNGHVHAKCETAGCVSWIE